MREIMREIQKNLDQIEKEYQVKILLAVESGSRAWGFASPDSDYDVRFIYMHSREEYLRIDDTLKDVIEWQLDKVLDINGWDLRKALLAYGKGNPNVMEWLNSPIVYRQTEEWPEIKEAALRPLLCYKWIERYHQVPPMEFKTLLQLFDGTDPDLNEFLQAGIQDLLARKAETEEKALNPQIPVIIDFIKAECERQKKISSSQIDDHKYDYTELNTMFRQVLKKRCPEC